MGSCGKLGDLMGHISDTIVFWSGQDLKNRPQYKHSRYFRSVETCHKDQQPRPLLVHGDGAPMAEFDSITVLSMRGILSKLPVSESQLALVALPKGCQAGPDTWRPIWDVLVWSFDALARGRHPDRQPNGDPWPAGDPKGLLAGVPLPAAVVSVVAGAMERFCQEFSWPYAMSSNPCAYCKCDNCEPPGPRPFTDFRKHAPWKRTMRTFRRCTKLLGTRYSKYQV